jgi:hypothetical protein
MTERYGTLKTNLEGPTSAGLKSFVYKLSDKCGTDLEIIYEEKGWFLHNMRIKVSGYESQLLRFQNVAQETIRKWQEDIFVADHYNVKNIDMQELSDNTLIVKVKAHRFSGIKDLATSIQDHFDFNMGTDEKKNLFSKDLTVKIKGDKKQLEQFKSVFLTYAHSKNPVKMQNLITNFSNDIEHSKKTKLRF